MDAGHGEALKNDGRETINKKTWYDMEMNQV